MKDSLIARVRGLLVEPKNELPKTIAEPGDFKSLLPYVTVLVSVGALARFISAGIIGTYQSPQIVFGMRIGGGWFRAPIHSLVDAVLQVGIGIASWWFLGFILAKLAPSFGARQDENAALKVAAWTATPIWVAGVLALLGSIPYLGWVPLVGAIAALVYAVMIGMWALPLLLGTPEPKAPGHILAALCLTVAAWLVVSFTFGFLAGLFVAMNQ